MLKSSALNQDADLPTNSSTLHNNVPMYNYGLDLLALSFRNQRRTSVL